DNCVIKNIKITDGNKTFKFKEKVQLFDLDQFKKMFDKTGFNLVSNYGDYDMRTYCKDSNRLILAVKKK
ncbi:MAG: SAM-dependent methyltransferase, partial [Crocinitomicaceae bacterium]|nr:SAM-dependent methyltransferase [Crocinitomicaceae bacterium]